MRIKFRVRIYGSFKAYVQGKPHFKYARGILLKSTLFLQKELIQAHAWYNSFVHPINCDPPQTGINSPNKINQKN